MKIITSLGGLDHRRRAGDERRHAQLDLAVVEVEQDVAGPGMNRQRRAEIC